MENSRVFGRRGSPTQRAPAPTQPARPPTPVLAPNTRPPGVVRVTEDDDALREWKQSRRKAFRIPWRPLWLVASPCFGIASLVLPDSVSDVLQWLLYGLMAASFIAGITQQ